MLCISSSAAETRCNDNWIRNPHRQQDSQSDCWAKGTYADGKGGGAAETVKPDSKLVDMHCNGKKYCKNTVVFQQWFQSVPTSLLVQGTYAEEEEGAHRWILA